jgi:hypothetical protein
MKMYNYEAEAFAQFLLTLELAGKQSRMRTKFCKILGDKMKDVDDDRVALAKEYAKKDANGEPMMITREDGSQVFDMEDLDAFNREYFILTREELIVDETPERADMINTIKDVVLNTDKIFSGQDAMLYDRWCEIVEGE